MTTLPRPRSHNLFVHVSEHVNELDEAGNARGFSAYLVIRDIHGNVWKHDYDFSDTCELEAFDRAVSLRERILASRKSLNPTHWQAISMPHRSL